jgi:DNA-binding transcriptional MerR regulator
MGSHTIGQVSKHFNISTRTLRYYEQIGLLPSLKSEDYAYRTYGEQALQRLQQIIILRKLRIPLKEIKKIMQSVHAEGMIQSFQAKVDELDQELTALSTIRFILNDFIGRLRQQVDVKVDLALLDDEALLAMLDSLTVTKIQFKEEKTMGDLNQAIENQSKLKDVRMVYIPPATVAASHYIGEEPEHHASKALEKFVRESGLCQIKPDLRNYGFNHPSPTAGQPVYGYEMWVTIPDDLEVPEPLVKKRFEGGLYAAHMIPMGNFHEWGWLSDWVCKDHPKYESNATDDGGECMNGLLEEHLNYFGHMSLPEGETEDVQLDLLFPVKLRARE